METNSICTEQILQTWGEAQRLWLFMDYDGTLADFAATPDIIEPDKELISLLSQLARRPNTRLAFISGRRLAHVQQLLPVSRAWLAGTYGLEMVSPTGDRIERSDYTLVRRPLEKIKPQLEALVSEYVGAYLEDKGWSLAVHARFVKIQNLDSLLESAYQIMARNADQGIFQLLKGTRFLEICPLLADKGKTVEYILEQDPWPGARLVYIGDDDKDERAFRAVQARGGNAVVVAPQPRASLAVCRLESPRQVREWLSTLSTMQKSSLSPATPQKRTPG